MKKKFVLSGLAIGAVLIILGIILGSKSSVDTRKLDDVIGVVSTYCSTNNLACPTYDELDISDKVNLNRVAGMPLYLLTKNHYKHLTSESCLNLDKEAISNLDKILARNECGNLDRKEGDLVERSSHLQDTVTALCTEIHVRNMKTRSITRALDSQVQDCASQLFDKLFHHIQ